ncbi:unnamed protein product [Amoebophrya sp. A25]|nr:unnamed protein product [Amoebophrya sp. A25]|eukprot:GSA25T00015860001.1
MKVLGFNCWIYRVCFPYRGAQVYFFAGHMNESSQRSPPRASIAFMNIVVAFEVYFFARASKLSLLFPLNLRRLACCFFQTLRFIQTLRFFLFSFFFTYRPSSYKLRNQMRCYDVM